MTNAELRSMGARLIALADRIEAGTLNPNELALVEGGTLAGSRPPLPPDDPSFLAQFASALLCARRLRENVLPSSLFADPAWDMLLDLYVHNVTGRRVSVQDACQASHVPPTTALRWLDLLASEGLIARSQDPRDARRRFIELTPRGEAVLTKLLGAMDRQIEQRSPRRLFRFKEPVI